MSTTARPVVAVLLGTDCHRFDRLVGWVQQAAASSDVSWFVQHGSTPLPADLHGKPLLGADELEDLLSRSAAVVTHGGPGLIMESRTHGHSPVVVARDPALREHVDQHQQRFVTRIAAAGLCTAANSQSELEAAVGSALVSGRTATQRESGGLPEKVGELIDGLVSAGRPKRRVGRLAWLR
ncbi:MAG TPA: glycosyltransferase [Actinophytocola sp.]|nr:glycosyltransferase [Actinophytocola sp.]